MNTIIQTHRKSNGERPGRKVITNPQDGQHQNEQDYTEPVGGDWRRACKRNSFDLQ